MSQPRRQLLPLLAVLAVCASASATVTATAAVDAGPRDIGSQQPSEKFTCEGRPAGFYADVASGCQMYHMCDESGRLFTHACPERTLFQQRTTVCDHWFMVECAADVAAASSAAASAPAPPQAHAPAAFPARKRHSHRVLATFPYQRRNDTAIGSSTVKSVPETLESFKISSIPSTTHRVAVTSTATVERVTRPSFFSVTPPPNFQNSQQNDFSIFIQPAPFVNRAKIERVFKESVLTSPDDEVVSHVQYISSFREPKAGDQFVSTTPRPTTEATPSLIENKYNSNPFFYRTSFTNTPATFSKSIQTTTQRPDEEENSENKLEIVIPDPRKMFYIPDSNYDPGDAAKGTSTVLIIEIPGKNMKFQSVGVTEARNHDCPQCHPSFLLPGLCKPCVLIRR